MAGHRVQSDTTVTLWCPSWANYSCDHPLVALISPLVAGDKLHTFVPDLTRFYICLRDLVNDAIISRKVRHWHFGTDFWQKVTLNFLAACYWFHACLISNSGYL